MMFYPETIPKPKRQKPRYVKPEAVQELERVATAEARRQHPGNPYIIQRTFRDDTANGLTACITAYLKLKGAFVSRVNNGGIYDKRLNRYRPGTNRKGLPDVICTWQSKSLMIECKIGRDKMSDAQQKIKQEQEVSGGLYYVAHNFTEFKQWFDNNVHLSPQTDN